MAEKGQVRFFVPLHFDIEVTRIICLKAKTGKDAFTKEWRDNALETLDNMPIETVALGLIFKTLGDLATAYDLDTPDVPYFHLARVMEFADVEAACGPVKKFLKRGDLVLLKASRAARLERLSAGLRVVESKRTECCTI